MPYQLPHPGVPVETIVREEPFSGERAEHEMLKGAHAELETDLRNARDTLTAYDAKIEGVEAERDALKGELEQLKGQLADLDGLHTSLQAEHDKLQADVKAAPVVEDAAAA